MGTSGCRLGAEGVARCGMLAALLAASAWVTVPLGPVPLTLQTMALAAVAVVAAPAEAILSVGLYLLMGACGLPVFSGLGAGVGQLAGPTGGFLWGFLAGMAVAQAVRAHGPGPVGAREVAGVAAMLAVTYALGTVQLALVTGMGPVAALATGVAPFLAPDAAKAAAGVAAGRAVRRALEAAGAAGS